MLIFFPADSAGKANLIHPLDPVGLQSGIFAHRTVGHRCVPQQERILILVAHIGDDQILVCVLHEIFQRFHSFLIVEHRFVVLFIHHQRAVLPRERNERLMLAGNGEGKSCPHNVVALPDRQLSAYSSSSSQVFGGESGSSPASSK